MNKPVFSTTLQTLRKEKKVTQEQLASHLGVSAQAVSKWENGTRRPDYTMVEKIAETFGVNADEIADRNDLIFRELSECVSGVCDIPDSGLAELISGFLKGLRDTEAKMFVQRYYFLKNTSDISRMFGLNENHVRSTLSRTRRKLRKYVKENVR